MHTPHPNTSQYAGTPHSTYVLFQIINCLATFDFETLRDGWSKAGELSELLTNLSHHCQEANTGIREVHAYVLISVAYELI